MFEINLSKCLKLIYPFQSVKKNTSFAKRRIVYTLVNHNGIKIAASIIALLFEIIYSCAFWINFLWIIDYLFLKKCCTSGCKRSIFHWEILTCSSMDCSLRTEDQAGWRHVNLAHTTPGVWVPHIRRQWFEKPMHWIGGHW